MDKSKHLAHSRLFRGLCDHGIHSLLEIAEMQMFDAGTEVFQQGDLGHELYVVLEGEVRISLNVGGGEEALTIVHPGDSFGEMSLIEPEPVPRSASAIVHQDCVLLAFGKSQILEVLDRDHDIAYVVFRNLLRELSTHLRATNQKLLFLASTGRF